MKKNKILEYYTGNPDTIIEYSDEGDEFVDRYNYLGGNVISFGFFQTSLDGGKEFVYSINDSHDDISNKLARKIIGKAMASDDIDASVIKDFKYAVYFTAAYTGRVFLKPRVITTWGHLSSDELYDIVERLGGIEKYGDFKYIYSNKKENLTVEEYIKSNQDGDRGNQEQMKEDMKDYYSIEDWMIDLVRKYNATSSWSAEKERSGWKTLAQRNAAIYQEGKKTKKSLKEKNMSKDKYQKEYSNYISIMNEALKKNDFEAYDAAKEMLEETIEDSKHEKALLKQMNTNNFGVLNHIFENELPTLFKTNKKAVREVIKTIKEDKNLLGQFNFYHIIKEQYKGDVVTKFKPNELLDKLTKIVSEDVNVSTVKDSNKKLRKVMLESGVVPTKFVDDESKKLYESGNVILTRKSTTTNMIPIIESYDVVCNYMEAHKNDKADKSKDIDTIIEEFENKMKDTLTESEISFVQQITDFRSPIAEQRKEKLFNKFKNECIEKLDEMLKEDSENSELKSLNSQIKEMKYNKESIVKDIAKLLEIRDILMDD